MSQGRRPGLPIYVQIMNSLKAAIARGEYRPDTPFITERKVREKFGVSTTTAIKALNELVAEGVLVRKQGSGTFVADRRPAHVDRPPRAAGQENVIACILQNQGPHVSAVLHGAETVAAELGYQMYLTHCNDDPEREADAIHRALKSGAKGIVLYPAEGSANADVFAEVRQRNLPLVMVDRYRLDMATDAVVADNISVGYEVTKHLIERGHRRIATLWDEIDCTSVRDRLSGHLQALRDHHVQIRPELTVLRHYNEQSSMGRDGIVAHLLRAQEPPTVLLCANGYALARVVNDLAELGDEATSAVELAGMDDAGPYDILPLTTVSARLPSRAIGEEAVRLLHERIVSGDPYRDVQRKVLPIQIRTRDAAPGYLRVIPAGTQSIL